MKIVFGPGKLRLGGKEIGVISDVSFHPLTSTHRRSTFPSPERKHMALKSKTQIIENLEAQIDELNEDLNQKAAHIRDIEEAFTSRQALEKNHLANPITLDIGDFHIHIARRGT